jgi:hypothetical protein
LADVVSSSIQSYLSALDKEREKEVLGEMIETETDRDTGRERENDLKLSSLSLSPSLSRSSQSRGLIQILDASLSPPLSHPLSVSPSLSVSLSYLEILFLALPLIRQCLSVIETQRIEREREKDIELEREIERQTEREKETKDGSLSLSQQYKEFTKRVREEVESLLFQLYQSREREIERDGETERESEREREREREREEREMREKLIDEGNQVIASIVQFSLSLSSTRQPHPFLSLSPSTTTTGCSSAREFFRQIDEQYFLPVLGERERTGEREIEREREREGDMQAVTLAYGLRQLMQGLSLSPSPSDSLSLSFSIEEIDSIVFLSLSRVLPFLSVNDSYLYLYTIRFLSLLMRKCSLKRQRELLIVYVSLFAGREIEIDREREDEREKELEIRSLLQSMKQGWHTDRGRERDKDGERDRKIERESGGGLQWISSELRVRVMLGEVLVNVLSDVISLSPSLSPSPSLSFSLSMESVLLSLLQVSLSLAKYHVEYRESMQTPVIAFDTFSGKRKPRGEREREKEKEKEKERERETGLGRETKRERQKSLITVIETEREGEKERQKETEREKDSDRESEGEIEKEIERERDEQRLDELYLRQSSLSLLSVILPLLSVTQVEHYLRDILSISQGIVMFEMSFHPIARACRR